MNTTKWVGMLCLGLITFTTQVSCKKKGCTDSLAENYESKAKKDDGSCTYARTKFLGSYQMSQNCSGDQLSYTLTIAEANDKDKIMLNNLQMDGYTVNIRATVNGSDLSFKETQQGIVFEGTGYITGNALTLNYDVCEEFYYPCSDPYSCTATGSK